MSATIAARAIFQNALGGQAKAIVGLKVCKKHKRKIKELGEVLGDGGDKLAEVLGNIVDPKHGKVPIVRKFLAWMTLDHPDAINFERMNEKEGLRKPS